jgi:branched-chain amino acid aminotransferase
MKMVRAQRKAQELGYTQVLWLDAVEHRYVEEVGTSNIFFLFQNNLVTPPLSGTILPGVTRDSVIRLAGEWGIKVSERSVTIHEVLQAARDGSLKEMFATGTAAVISPVGEIGFQGQAIPVADGKTGPLAQRLYDEITGIQYGKKKDPFGWVVKIA